MSLNKKAYMRVYRQTHREEANAYNKTWNQNHKERIAISKKKHLQNVKKEVFDHYGNFCHCCGETEPKFLTIDHINGDGAKHRKEVGEGSTFYSWLVKNNFPNGFRTLCYNCNIGRKNGPCPHEEKMKFLLLSKVS